MKIPSLGFTKFKNYLKYKTFHNNQITKNVIIANNVELTNSKIDDFAAIRHHASIRNCNIGKYTSVGRYTKIMHTDIGAFCSISWDTTINAIQHPLNRLTVNAFPYISDYGGTDKRSQFYKRVFIKNDVWIGANSVILPGLKIGNGAVIAANTLVTRNVPDYAIVAGVPSKILRFRFRKEIINRLQELKWWELDFEVIKKNMSVFQSVFNMENIKELENIVNSQSK